MLQMSYFRPDFHQFSSIFHRFSVDFQSILALLDDAIGLTLAFKAHEAPLFARHRHASANGFNGHLKGFERPLGAWPKLSLRIKHLIGE